MIYGMLSLVNSVQKRVLLSALLLIALGSAIFAETRIANDPLRLNVGARPLGMGRAFSSVADDPSAIFMNPAGLGALTNWELTSMSGKYLNEFDYLQLAGALPTNFGTFGVGYGSSGIAISISSEANYQWNNAGLVLSYGKNLGFGQIRNLYLGASLKLFSQALSGSGMSTLNATGYDMDIGALYKPLEELNLAATVQNVVPSSLGSGINWNNGVHETFPTSLKLALAYRLLGESGKIKWRDQDLLLAVDYELFPLNKGMTPAAYFGLEWSPVETLALRAGSDNGDYTLGVGINYEGYRFDYAFHSYNNVQTSATNYFSLSYGIFNPKKKTVSKEYFKFLSPNDYSAVYQDRIILRGKALDKEVARIIIPAFKQISKPADLTDSSYLKMYLGYNPISVKVYTEGGNLIQVHDLQKLYTETGVPVAKNNIFDFELDLSPGINFITVEAYDNNGNFLKSITWHGLLLKNFSDLHESYWAALPVSALATAGIMAGYPDGTFQPKDYVTRADLCVILGKINDALNLKAPATKSIPEFKDVPLSSPQAKYIYAAVAQGWTTGVTAKSFKPDNILSRVEAVYIIARFAGLSINDTRVILAPYIDVPGRHWAAKEVTAANEAGLLKFIHSTYLEPDRYINRAELAAILYQTDKAKMVLAKNGYTQYLNEE